MKKYSLTMMAGFAALAIASTASAQTTTFRVTGSTAFRAATHIAIGHILNAGYTWGYLGTECARCKSVRVHWNDDSGQHPRGYQMLMVRIRRRVQTVSQNLNVSTWLNAGTNLTTGGASVLLDLMMGRRWLTLACQIRSKARACTPRLIWWITLLEWCRLYGFGKCRISNDTFQRNALAGSGIARSGSDSAFAVYRV